MNEPKIFIDPIERRWPEVIFALFLSFCVVITCYSIIKFTNYFYYNWFLIIIGLALAMAGIFLIIMLLLTAKEIIIYKKSIIIKYYYWGKVVLDREKKSSILWSRNIPNVSKKRHGKFTIKYILIRNNFVLFSISERIPEFKELLSSITNE